MLSTEQIKSSPETLIKWMVFDSFITIDKQILNLSFEPRKEMLVGGSYGYFVKGKFRTKKWINSRCVNVLGYIFND